jgi:hypothetical protein
MNDMQKKIVAALSAVMQYLQFEEEMAALQLTPTAPEAAPPSGPKLWALNSRLNQMQYRNLMQLRSLGRRL